MHNREARLSLCSSLNGGHILITQLMFKGIRIFVKNIRSLTIAVTVTFKAQKGLTLFYQGPGMMELQPNCCGIALLLALFISPMLF